MSKICFKWVYWKEYSKRFEFKLIKYINIKSAHGEPQKCTMDFTLLSTADILHAILLQYTYTYLLCFFMPPGSKIGGHIVFVLSVFPSFHHSVILSLCHSLWNFNLANNFWTVSTRVLIFHMSILCDKTFPLVPLFLTL